jgi:long-chain acyl-CoA synthetase
VTAADGLRARAEADPDKAALIFQGRAISYADLDDRVDLTAAALGALGVARGDRVALLAGNVPEYASTLYGVLRAGAVACPLNTMLTPEELRAILADAGARVAVCELSTLPSLAAAREGVPGLETVLAIGGPPAPAGTISLEEALLTQAEPPERAVAEDDPAVIAYTAGTTAAPKGAVLSHGNLVANLEQMAQVPDLALREDDVVLLALPVFHIYGLNVGLGLTLSTGATAVLVERFDPAETLELVERHGVTVLLGAPPMFGAWLAAGADRTRFGSVRLAVSGAAALPPEVLRAFQERTGVTIWEGYGLTECAPVVTTNALGPVAKPGSIGLPLPGVEVRLVGEDGEDVDDEEDDPGEIWVRGPNVFHGYWNRRAETDQVLEGGWLRTGDVAYRDEDGYLFLVDRKKDLVIVSGFNVYPREVEEAIARDPRVREAAVVGIPDERTGEAVQAWVVPVEGVELTADDVLHSLHGVLARFKQPKEVLVVEDLPHHVTGKVLRRALRDQPEEWVEAEDQAETDPEFEAGGEQPEGDDLVPAEEVPGEDVGGDEAAPSGEPSLEG